MNSSSVLPGPRQPFVRFGLLVTGRSEAAFLPKFFRSVSETGRCSFEVIRRIGQLSPKSPENKLRMAGTDPVDHPSDASPERTLVLRPNKPRPKWDP